jgi:hypothetical protein
MASKKAIKKKQQRRMGTMGSQYISGVENYRVCRNLPDAFVWSAGIFV